MELFCRYDLILDGTDNFATRYLVNDAAALAGKPYVWGSILRFDGQVSVFWDAYGPNYRDLYPSPPPPGTVPSCSEGGVFGVLCAQVGSVMVAEAIKLITGVGRTLLGRLLILDSLEMTLARGLAAHRIPTSPRSPDCCPATTTSARPRRWTPRGCGAPAEHSIRRAGAGRAAGRSARRASEDFLLIDVRERGEAEIVSIPGAILAPRGAILSGEIELPRDRELILHCKSGGRSSEVLRYLLRQRIHPGPPCRRRHPGLDQRRRPVVARL